ncbi:MAG: hypothetical protein PWR01_4298 [Clostridiales bacterium]|nr:hypothetical protein [Clostridiales bacterium]MDN5283225.1 hypothetical protein [Candidatus Ozemobacter sp.]
MEELLNNFMRFIDAEADSEKEFDPDKKINEQFDYLFDETDFRIAMVKFEMDQLIDIPRTPKNYELSLRELCEKISELSKIKKANVPTFLKKKKSELAKITQEIAADLNKMFF